MLELFRNWRGPEKLTYLVGIGITSHDGLSNTAITKADLIIISVVSSARV